MFSSTKTTLYELKIIISLLLKILNLLLFNELGITELEIIET